MKTAIFCICGSNNWETVVETGKLGWATYRFDPYDRHNLFILFCICSEKESLSSTRTPNPSTVCFQLALVKLFGDLVQDHMYRFYQDFCQQITPYILMYLVLTSTCYANYVDPIYIDMPFCNNFAYHFLG